MMDPSSSRNVEESANDLWLGMKRHSKTTGRKRGAWSLVSFLPSLILYDMNFFDWMETEELASFPQNALRHNN